VITHVAAFTARMVPDALNSMGTRTRCMLWLRRPGVALFRSAATIGDPDWITRRYGFVLSYEPLHERLMLGRVDELTQVLA